MHEHTLLINKICYVFLPRCCNLSRFYSSPFLSAVVSYFVSSHQPIHKQTKATKSSLSSPEFYFTWINWLWAINKKRGKNHEANCTHTSTQSSRTPAKRRCTYVNRAREKKGNSVVTVYTAIKVKRNMAYLDAVKKQYKNRFDCERAREDNECEEEKWKNQRSNHTTQRKWIWIEKQESAQNKFWNKFSLNLKECLVYYVACMAVLHRDVYVSGGVDCFDCDGWMLCVSGAHSGLLSCFTFIFWCSLNVFLWCTSSTLPPFSLLFLLQLLKCHRRCFFPLKLWNIIRFLLISIQTK